MVRFLAWVAALFLFGFVATLIFFSFIPFPVNAATLRVSPTSLSLLASGSAETVTLRNEASRPLNIQLRVFRWTQSGGVDRLEPTSNVVASPPATTLLPNAEYVVRIVRVAGSAVTRQESYRVLIDELPDPGQQRAGAVNLVLRHSLPVFFRPADAGPPNLVWSVGNAGGAEVVLRVHNTGGSSVRLADVSLSQGSRRVAIHKGLVGHVLPGATMQWRLPRSSKLSGASASLSAGTEAGQINATVPVQGH